MELTQQQALEIYDELDKATIAARKAMTKAEKEYNGVPYVYGGSFASEKAAMMLQLRTAQYRVAADTASEFFNLYLAKYL
jgi:hypothetical protein